MTFRNSVCHDFAIFTCLTSKITVNNQGWTASLQSTPSIRYTLHTHTHTPHPVISYRKLYVIMNVEANKLHIFIIVKEHDTDKLLLNENTLRLFLKQSLMLIWPAFCLLEIIKESFNILCFPNHFQYFHVNVW